MNIMKKRALIIDDDSRSRRLFNSHLTSMGFETVLSDGYLEAIELLSQDSHFDLIIADLVTPSLRGFDFTMKIRESSKLKDIPVVGTCTFLHWKMLKAKNAHDLGLDGFVIKPVTKNVLENEIQKILKDWTIRR